MQQALRTAEPVPMPTAAGIVNISIFTRVLEL